MMFSLRGLASSFNYHDLKAMIRQTWNIHNFKLDNLCPDGRGCKQVDITVFDEAEADQLAQCLDGFTTRGSTLTVVLSNNGQQNSNYNQGAGRHSYNNLRQPGSGQWAANDDQWNANRGPSNNGFPQSNQSSSLQQQREFELQRKKQELLEEERKLQEEKKKLDMLKCSGNTEPHDFETAKKSGWVPSLYATPHGVPIFAMPCKHLLKEMRPHVCKATRGKGRKHERRMLMQLIRTHLRRTLTLAMEHKGYMSTGEIMELYRETHPRHQDEMFVMSMAEELRFSCWPFHTVNEPSRKKKKKKKNSDGPGAQNTQDVDMDEDDDGWSDEDDAEHEM